MDKNSMIKRIDYHFDWLCIEQDFGYNIPESVLCNLFDFGVVGIHLSTGELQDGVKTGRYRHKGSFCDELSIQIRGSVIRMEGNPSRWGKLDNLLGFKTVDSCVNCFNRVLNSLNLPSFTKCTQIYYSQNKAIERVQKFSDGAIIKRLDITTNKSVGRGKERTFLKALSQIRYRNSIGRLHTNGLTVDWLSAKGNANLIYPSVYIKHEEIKLHSLEKIKNKFGVFSEEFNYISGIINHCEDLGVVRFEQKLKSRFLKKEDLCYWGISDYSRLDKLQEEFLNMHKTLRVSSFEIETISEQLLNCGAVKNMRQANTTAFYACKWSSGQSLDLKERQFKEHRARLRKIGIDIANPCDIDKYSAVRVFNIEEIFVKDFRPPVGYRNSSNLPTLRKVA